MQEKLKSLTDEILLIQEEKHNLAREKYRIEKRFEEMQKSSEDLRQKEIQIHSLTENERTSEIAWLKKELRKYE